MSFCCSAVFVIKSQKQVETRLVTARNEVGARLCFYTCLCDSVHRGVVSQHALQVVSQHALQVVSQHALQQVSRGRGGVIPACLAGFQAHTQGGS